MSEFSDKLSEYIAKSGSNVYQLAKEASLDRTTLQKTAKGQRLPSLDYIREICQYIKISSKQEEELVRLYKIEKLGHSTVKAWDEIQQIILDIYQLGGTVFDTRTALGVILPPKPPAPDADFFSELLPAPAPTPKVTSTSGRMIVSPIFVASPTTVLVDNTVSIPFNRDSTTP